MVAFVCTTGEASLGAFQLDTKIRVIEAFGLQSFGEILQDYGPWREPFVSGLPFMKKHVITLLKCDSPKTRLDRKFNKLLERIPFKLYHVLCSYSMQIRKLLSHYLDKQFAGTS